ncbi:MAG: LysR family transcriptional regulator [Roseobacter sp.]|nr:LysR family transcriptional regulator [Roseobacter sp.]
MNLNALRSLVRIGQVQSFSKAADIENMTLSALSMQMKSLEHELDARLFDRSFRPPKLTPVGKTVATQAARMLQLKQEIVDACTGSETLAGRFHLGFIQSTSVRIMPGFLKTAREMHPGAAFSLTSGLSEDLTEQVRLGLMDAAVVTRVAGQTGDLHHTALGTERMAFAMPLSFQDSDMSDVHAQLPFIHFRPTSGIGQLIASAMAARLRQPDEIIVLDSLEAAMECVKEGLGYTLLPLPDIQRCCDGRAHVHVPDSPTIRREIVMVVRRENAKGRWAKVLGRRLADCFPAGAVD